ncbi:MAG: type IV pilin biogenesis protein [Deltaproteobacteria bacterium]|nr:type IV pilin biogenesis protein [Deltaproteobacteria bacterium]
MVSQRSSSRASALLRALRRALWLAAVVVVAWASRSSARLQPYYVVQGLGAHEIRPRVLFVLDTSGSMSWRAQAAEEQCSWRSCELGEGSQSSRIAVARKAIRNVVTAAGDSARFALMTFDQRHPPTSVPRKCSDGHRFQWTTFHGYFVWDNVDKYSGYYGTWRLCDDVNRPYPYLRWDNLGVGAVISANNQAGAIPASPLISTAATSMKASSNADRKVQWFPRFMGVRANLNATTDPDRSITHATVGDYGTTTTDTDANVWGKDFYYWPYVDGFPGYSASVGYPYDGSRVPYMGVTAGSTTAQAALYAPFYLDLPASTADAVRGPTSVTAAHAAVAAAVAPMIEGGVDADAGTPWASAIGAKLASPPESNAIYAHSSVTSYLQYVANSEAADACAPTVAVLVTDGQPSPESEGGALLHERLAVLRNELGVRTYVVGFFLDEPELHAMACAAAGACSGSCSSPCSDTPANDWDTCADPSDPSHGCAYLASSSAELAGVLTQIVQAALSVEVDSGPGARIADFGVGEHGTPGQGRIVQTTLRAHTDVPSWRGHLERSVCTDEDPAVPGDPAPWCVDQPFEADEVEETFGPCAQSRSWDAAACLAQTEWKARRLYTHTAANEVVPFADDDGRASAALRTELADTGAMSAADVAAHADDFAAFVLGRDFPDGAKLPGVANSAPVVVRRIPKRRPEYSPQVAIRDPHCGGRRLSEVDAAGLPESLESFAAAAWSNAGMLASPSPHHAYQEAVLVGDDLGVLHAFQLDSGNELFGFVPRFSLRAAVAQWRNGAASMGQSSNVASHIYGIASTVNEGWVYDEAATRWRHLAVFGLGAGGTELIALDVSHMSPSADDGPIEVLWTSDDAALRAAYDAVLGETWSRPALAYDVPGNVLGAEPQARLVFGSGYRRAGAAANAGRTLVYADAVTGAILEQAVIDAATDGFDSSYAAVGDVAIASHCISRYWGEIQEVYAADPAGRLFRWDLGGGHAADSGGAWGGSAREAVRLHACEGDGSTCTVGTSHGDPFLFGPAVTAGGRIDPPGGAASGEPPLGVDQFLVALASGSPSDDSTPAATSRFHSSLYLLVDDHSHAASDGFDVPSGGPKVDPSAPATYPHYLRLAVTDIERTREFTPFDGAPTYEDVGHFGRGTRPIRAPRIEVSGAVDTAAVADDGQPRVIEGVEVYRVTYTLYEPPSNACDARFYDRDNGLWHVDEGATFEITLRTTAIAGAGFDFTQGAADGPATFDASFEPGLVLESVTQVRSGTCADGSCGPRIDPPRAPPCDNNTAQPGLPVARGFAVPVQAAELVGFTPIE